MRADFWAHSAKNPAMNPAKTKSLETAIATPGEPNTDPVGAAHVQHRLPSIPHAPGCYKMIGDGDEVLYVGKARNLRKRVASYARLRGHTMRIRRMIQQITRIEIIPTDSEVKAFILESQLIKSIMPRYNVLLKDSKSYPHILVRGDHAFPQIVKHRGQRTHDGEYYGPFANAMAVNRALTAIQKGFQLRTCSDTVFAGRRRPCMQYQIKRCSAPCVGLVDDVTYGKAVTDARDFLHGRAEGVRQRLIDDITQASEAWAFERARSLRNRLESFARVQIGISHGHAELGNTDIIIIARAGGRGGQGTLAFGRGVLEPEGADGTRSAEAGVVDRGDRIDHGDRGDHGDRDADVGLDRGHRGDDDVDYDTDIVDDHDIDDGSDGLDRGDHGDRGDRGDADNTYHDADIGDDHDIDDGSDCLDDGVDDDDDDDDDTDIGDDHDIDDDNDGLDDGTDHDHDHDNDHDTDDDHDNDDGLDHGHRDIDSDDDDSKNSTDQGDECDMKATTTKKTPLASLVAPSSSPQSSPSLPAKTTPQGKEKVALGACVVEVFFLRAGYNFGQRLFHPKHAVDTPTEEVLESFLGQFYADKAPPAEILLNHSIKHAAWLSAALSDRENTAIKVLTPKRGPRKRAIDAMAVQTQRALARILAEKSHNTGMLAAFAERFGVQQTPIVRIDVFDNSHLSGKHAVGAMIVASPDGFAKAEYRKFNIKKIARDVPVRGGDDFAMMREVLMRRLKKLDEADPAKQPQVLLIDGGLGQLNVAVEVCESLGIKTITVVAIAKGKDRNAGRERFFVRFSKHGLAAEQAQDGFRLPSNDPLLYYLQRLRDESHRFVIGTHRALRSKGVRESVLDGVSGVGIRRKRALMAHFGSVGVMRESGVEDIAAVPGIDRRMAERIWNHLQEE